jgi:DNA-binding XRE family transcriptional regulator
MSTPNRTAPVEQVGVTRQTIIAIQPGDVG